MRSIQSRCQKFYIICTVMLIFIVVVSLNYRGVRYNHVKYRRQGTSEHIDIQTVKIPSQSNGIMTKSNATDDDARLTILDDIFISVKSSKKFHEERLQVLFDTWIRNARNQTFIFTDADDPELAKQIDESHIINTKCQPSHKRNALACKMGKEFDGFVGSKKRWFCHVDDDNYVNVDGLLTFLQQYNHTDDWYLGKPSLSHPLEINERGHPRKRVAFWFATGGAGFCISRSLATKMVPHAGSGMFLKVANRIGLPDDCTVGYIIGRLLGKELTVIREFHSHREPILLLGLSDLKKQLTFGHSYKKQSETPDFPESKDDPSRFRAVHSYLYPSATS